MFQGERGSVEGSGQSEAEARSAAEGGPQGEPPPLGPREASTRPVPACPRLSLSAAHPVPAVSGPVQRDSGTQEEDVGSSVSGSVSCLRARRAHLSPVSRLHSPLMLNDSGSAHSMPKYSRPFSLEVNSSSPPSLCLLLCLLAARLPAALLRVSSLRSSLRTPLPLDRSSPTSLRWSRPSRRRRRRW